VVVVMLVMQVLVVMASKNTRAGVVISIYLFNKMYGI